MTLLEQLTEATEHVKALNRLDLEMQENGAEFCAVNAELHIYRGIEKLASAANKELILEEQIRHKPIKHFLFCGVYVFQLGEYDAGEAVFK